jgi:adenosylmethionine-8-amino-7-oxononanoate aminotransferase
MASGTVRTGGLTGRRMSTTDKILYSIFGRQNPRVQRAAGYYYYDTNGNQYLDATSGAYNCVLGHTMPERVARVLRGQTEKFSFASMEHFENEAANRLADRLLALMPDFAATCFYQSGADAVEAALRCALQVASTRHSAARSKIIGRRGAYHGLTLGALALAASDSIRQQDVPNFLHIEAQDCFSCPFGLEYPRCEVKCASALGRLIEKEGPETIAAFVAVPSTSGGPVPDEYWPHIRAICDRYGILLVSDEVLEGMWRTGPAVALKRWGVTPDVVATGKVLGAGFMPIFAMLVTDAVRDTLSQNGRFPGGHTFTGHVLSCEVALAVLDEIESRKLSSSGVESVGRELNAVLSRICERVAGARMATLGTMARLRIPCTVPGDPRTFHLKVQALLRAAGLVVWVDDVQQLHIDLGFGLPFIADEEFFHELEIRLSRFLEKLPPPFPKESA